MPASSKALPAGSIFGLSFFGPMMIPTCGSSTSISSNASSTAGIVAVSAGSGGGAAAGPGACGSSEISLIYSSLVMGTLVIENSSRSTADALDGAGGYIAPDLHSLEGDPAG